MDSIKCFFYLTENWVFFWATCLLSKNKAYFGRAQVMLIVLFITSMWL